MKFKLLMISAILITSALQSATVQDLQNKEQELYNILSEHWIDKKGALHLGNKDDTKIHFALSESVMKLLSVDEIKASLNTPMSRFTSKEKDATPMSESTSKEKDAFLQAIAPFLNQLATVRNELQALRTKLNTYAGTLAINLGKTQQNVMQLPLINIKNLRDVLINDPKADPKKKTEINKVDLSEFDNLREAFDIKIVKPIPVKRTEDTFVTPTYSHSGTGKSSSSYDKGSSYNKSSSSSRRSSYDDDDDYDYDYFD